MRFDPAEAGILIPQVAEAGDQQPFVRSGARFVSLAARIPGRQLGQASFERQALFQQRRQSVCGIRPVCWRSIVRPSSGTCSAEGRPVPTVSGEMLKRTMMLGYMEMKSISATSLVQPDDGLVNQPALVGVEQVQGASSDIRPAVCARGPARPGARR